MALSIIGLEERGASLFLEDGRQLPGQVMHIGDPAIGPLSSPWWHLVGRVASEKDAAMLKSIHHAHSGLPGHDAFDLDLDICYPQCCADKLLATFRGKRCTLPWIVGDMKDPAILKVDRGKES